MVRGLWTLEIVEKRPQTTDPTRNAFYHGLREYLPWSCNCCNSLPHNGLRLFGNNLENVGFGDLQNPDGHVSWKVQLYWGGNQKILSRVAPGNRSMRLDCSLVKTFGAWVVPGRVRESLMNRHTPLPRVTGGITLIRGYLDAIPLCRKSGVKV